MGKNTFTLEDIDAYRGRPAFTDETKAEMEARWSRQSKIYQPQLVDVNAEPQLHVICQACGCLGQAATMHIGHITTWKEHVKAAMRAQQANTISTRTLIALFNDPSNLRWEHAVCNESHAFEEGDPFAKGLDPEIKLAMLARVKFIREGGFAPDAIKQMTPQEFQRHANRKFVPTGQEGAPQASEMTTGAQISTAALPPRIDNDEEKPIDLATLTRKSLGWFGDTRKALFRVWNGLGLVGDVGQITYLRCGSCQRFTEGSSMHMGHKTVWKLHLQNKGVTNLKDAKIAYNDLDNLRFECSKCNTSHDWESLTEEEQDALDNALYRVADQSGMTDESRLMRTLVFGELKNLPDDLVVDGELMRRVAAFARAQGAMEALGAMAEALAGELEAERRAADLSGQAVIDDAIASEAESRAHEAEETARQMQDYVIAERARFEQEAAQAHDRAQAMIHEAELAASQGRATQSDVDQAYYAFEQVRQDFEERNLMVSGHEHDTAQAVGAAQEARHVAEGLIRDAQLSRARFEQADTALKTLRAENERQREARAEAMYGIARQAADDWSADEQYYMLRGVLDPAQLDGLKLLQAALRAEVDYPHENSAFRKDRILNEVELGLRWSKLDYKSPEFKDADSRRALVDRAFAYAHAREAGLQRLPDPKLRLGGREVPMDLLYDNLVVIRETGQPSDEVKRIFMQKLNGAY
ncbi:GH-E family nuclease [Epibacterium sp. Ofav1-8]|uniref:GH-E family nuclease n=1 Tax=Epibacterium sp. Ofav1-8 TaxID=2917735 RepID=UPI001EF5F528|nr:GH-E family nuclease [Epibacterium sp. Ofav1-8]MCG7624996.1 GH-E family nuclease [Epibacterium sp. Ofav1-8]